MDLTKSQRNVFRPSQTLRILNIGRRLACSNSETSTMERTPSFSSVPPSPAASSTFGLRSQPRQSQPRVISALGRSQAAPSIVNSTRSAAVTPVDVEKSIKEMRFGLAELEKLVRESADSSGMEGILENNAGPEDNASGEKNIRLEALYELTLITHTAASVSQIDKIRNQFNSLIRLAKTSSLGGIPIIPISPDSKPPPTLTELATMIEHASGESYNRNKSMRDATRGVCDILSRPS